MCVGGGGVDGWVVGQMPTITLERMFVCGFGYLLCQAFFSWKIHNENMPIQNTEKGLLHGIGNLHWFLPTLGIGGNSAQWLPRV